MGLQKILEITGDILKIHSFTFYLFLKICRYSEKLESVVLHKDGDIETVPELYYVPWNHVGVVKWAWLLMSGFFVCIGG